MQRSDYRAVAIRRSALCSALALCFASGAVLAQSNASGVVFGRVAQADGSVVHVRNLDTGVTRDITVDADGRYRATSLPVGRYSVSLERGGTVVETRDNVQVNIGGGVDVSFGTSVASSTEAQNLEGVQVTGTALPAIDVSSVDSRTVLTAQQLQKIPIARDVTAAALLAPGVVAGDARYGNVASFGGSSASENQYYINGYSVTNALTGLGFVSLPFDAIDQQQIFTGGYGAEYGRSTGGVINIVTKRGGNEWKAGLGLYVTPQGLRQTPRSIYREDGTLWQNRRRNKSTDVQYTGYISGPLIKDKLFLYAAGDFTRSDSRNTSSIVAPQRTYQEAKATKWLAKIDWNITDNHLLEVTGFGDKNNVDRSVYAYDYDVKARGGYIGTDNLKNFDALAGAAPGGDVYVGKYTGYITDNLTINALYGHSKTVHERNLAYASNANCPWILDNRGLPSEQITGCGLVNGTVLGKGAEDKTHGWRFDVEYIAGDHDLRAGVDNQTLESYSGNVYEGGYRWIYGPAGDIPSRGIVRPPGVDYYAQKRLFLTGASVKVEQEAQFIEDKWQITDRWLASIGLRNEQFKNINGDGQTYVKQRHQLAPRLGLTWDVFGDSTFKIYGNAGRYHLAIPSNVAIRGASASTYYSEYYTYTGVAANGEPTGIQQIGTRAYLNGEDGTPLNPKTIASQGIDAYYQDEYILGFDKAINANWSFGAKATLRKLKSSIDDFCDSRPFEKYAARNGIDLTNASIPGCYLFNPGKSNTFLVDIDSQGTLVPFALTKDDFTSPEGVAFPDLKRKYYSLELYLEHQLADNWYARVDYTFSRSYGNSEGQLKSDIGQVDPSVTQDWDAPEIMQYSNGPLPNDRTHQLKAYGYWQATPEWLIGANVAMATGRPKNCLGQDPVDAIQYGASYFECGFQPAPRGSQGRLPWTWSLDLNAEYRPTWAGANQPLAFTAAVFNVAGKQRTVAQIDTGELDTVDDATGLPAVNPDYRRPVAYQSPRYFRLGVRYDFSL
ncbi:Carboxypeptidase regulatory-like domain-containing protein [Luteibacter sp. UNC138MFCol5.1]|uniref:TonB-dependent receptor n=1 Tax=Luteibacter sp. UNC138MFCol5.1 TaxID=1502774 RepID=UPI0008C93868|nr:TonB-dependent receptor [Luteibacter sp. UNC138MFCol5.1]SEO36970.1 Carboxypeptidase regulatory-like domain-containing protein [Luteibacter sp. UNC138MFCol5.1]